MVQTCAKDNVAVLTSRSIPLYTLYMRGIFTVFEKLKTNSWIQNLINCFLSQGYIPLPKKSLNNQLTKTTQKITLSEVIYFYMHAGSSLKQQRNVTKTSVKNTNYEQ